MNINGLWFDGHSSASENATLNQDENGKILIRTSSITFSSDPDAIEVSSRLGNTPRRLRFDNGGLFETDNNDAIDQLFSKQSSQFRLHKLESNILLGLCGVVLLGLFAWWFLTDGLPRASKTIAFQLPESITQSLGEQLISFLDYTSFEESLLSPQKKQEVTNLFFDIVNKSDMQDKGCEIKFYSAIDSFGPNAFALPPCIIIATDEFVEVAANNDEISAVLAHEIGHIHHRHSLRHIVQSSFVSFAILMISGDATQLPADLLGFSAVFMELSYSRDFEREADLYAHQYMTKHNIPLKSFPDVLKRMEHWIPPMDDSDKTKYEEGNNVTLEIPNEELENNDSQVHDEKSEETWNINWSSYFSTHPDTEERAELFK